MKAQIPARIITASLFGVLMAGYMHHEHFKGSQMGREEFLIKQGQRFDRHFAKPDSIVLEAFVCLVIAGFGFGTYELVALGISKALKPLGGSEQRSELGQQ